MRDSRTIQRQLLIHPLSAANFRHLQGNLPAHHAETTIPIIQSANSQRRDPKPTLPNPAVGCISSFQACRRGCLPGSVDILVACDTLLEYLIGRRDSRAIERMLLLRHGQAGQGLAANQELSMIVIPRKVGESIVIWDNITVTIIEIRGDKVRLGIEHPTDVPVHRQEVFDAIRRGEAESVRPG